MGQPDAEQMRGLVREGKAMAAPGQDRPGRFQIRNREDLLSAIRAVGRVRPNTEGARAKVRRFIMRRAREMNMAGVIPDSWASDGSLKS